MDSQMKLTKMLSGLRVEKKTTTQDQPPLETRSYEHPATCRCGCVPAEFVILFEGIYKEMKVDGRSVYHAALKKAIGMWTGAPIKPEVGKF